MKNKILEELWRIKDKMSEDSNFDIEILAKKLKVVDFTTEASKKNKKIS